MIQVNIVIVLELDTDNNIEESVQISILINP